MKKLIFSALILMSSAAFVNAQIPAQTQAPSTEQSQCEGEFVSGTLTALGAPVQDAIQALASDAFTVKGVEYNNAKELTRVTLVSKADKSEKCVILDNAGKEITEAAPLAPAVVK